MRVARTYSIVAWTTLALAGCGPADVGDVVSEAHETVNALPSDYTYTVVAQLGQDSPCEVEGVHAKFTNDFEVSTINNHGQLTFVVDQTTGGEGAFLATTTGGLQKLACSGEVGPDGATFGFAGEVGRVGLNEKGDAAFGFSLEGISSPIFFGVGGSVFRFSHLTQKLSRLYKPFVAPAPGGGTFVGVFYDVALNDCGNLVFSGLVGNDPDCPSPPLLGVFGANQQGNITAVARPDQTQVEGSTFEYTFDGFNNNANDVAFEGRLFADPCIQLPGPPPLAECGNSIFLKSSQTSVITTIARQGQAIPASAGGGTLDWATAPTLNNAGQIVFAGAVADCDGLFGGDNLNVFVWSNGTIQKIARTDNPMPGGGTFQSSSHAEASYYINDQGDVAFLATLTSGEQAAYTTRNGVLKLVAKAGMEIPGLGTIVSFDFFDDPLPGTGVSLNELGQVVFAVNLGDGHGALLVATPI